MSRQSRPCTVFLHIPKTGGVTLRAALRHKYPGAALTLHSPRAPERVAEVPFEQRLAARVLTGHLPYGVDRHMPQACEYVTLLREPVARVISTFHHVADHPEHWFHDELVATQMGLLEFVDAEHGPFDNLQTRLISDAMEGDLVVRRPDRIEPTPLGLEALAEAKRNLDAFLVVGLTERFDESFLLIRRALGWKLPMYAKRNVRRGSRPRGSEPEVAIERIRRRDQLDSELYAHGERLLDAAVAQAGRSFQRELAAFKMLNQIPLRVAPRIPKRVRDGVAPMIPR